MYCPDYSLIRTNFIILTMYSDRDVPTRFVPKAQWINPFRYEILFFHKKGGGYRININKGGKANITFSNIKWRLYGRRLHDLKHGKRIECPSCKRGGFGPSHEGSRLCKSGSIASGGNRSHCTCDVCF